LFVSYLLRTIDFQSHSGKSGVPGVNRKDLHALTVRLPGSTEEQCAIAAALSDVDELLRVLTRLIVKKRNLKQASMQQLLAGHARLPGFSGEWVTSNLGDKALKVGSGITPTGGSRVYRESGRPFIRSRNVGWGELLLDDIVFIDDETHNAFSSTEIEIGDVLLNITGASIGRSAVADSRLDGGNVNQHVCIIRPKPEELQPNFLKYVLLSGPGQKHVASFQAGGNRQGLNFAQIRSMKLRLPPFPEQNAIAHSLSDMDAEIAALERRVRKTEALKKGMMQELLTGSTRLVSTSLGREG